MLSFILILFAMHAIVWNRPIAEFSKHLRAELAKQQAAK
jgi:hypothetical protein